MIRRNANTEVTWLGVLGAGPITRGQNLYYINKKILYPAVESATH